MKWGRIFFSTIGFHIIIYFLLKTCILLILQFKIGTQITSSKNDFDFDFRKRNSRDLLLA